MPYKPMTGDQLRARILERHRAKVQVIEDRKYERQEAVRTAKSRIVLEDGRTYPRIPGITVSDFVYPSKEIERIFALPTYSWEQDADLDKLIDDLTMWLKTKGGTMRLRPVQAAALQAIHDRGGCLGAIGVGEGKTLISYLACKVLDLERLVLLVPAKLRDKTKRDFEELSAHWYAPSQITVVSYEQLGRLKGEKLLSETQPEIIVADEAHRLKNLKAACTRRVARYIAQNPSTKFVALSGTMTNRSLADYAHLSRWCLGDPYTPLPNTEFELRRWCQAIDEKVETRINPGALSQFAEDPETQDLDEVRKGLARRIYNTPGVVRTSTTTVEASILIEPFEFGPRHERVQEALDGIYSNHISPSGDEMLPSDVWRVTRELALGFYYKWIPSPPEEWLEARKKWRRFVREVMETTEMDSEMVVARECAEGRLFSYNRYEEWTDIRDVYTPQTVAVWLDETPLRSISKLARDMGAQCQGPVSYPLIWVEHVSVGNRLASYTGWPYYHRQGKTDPRYHDPKCIDDHDPSESPAILSIAANSEGRNLQHWNSNIVVTPPSSGKTWEQLIGRTHRTGQTSDEVRVVVAMGHQSIYNTWSQVLADAKYVADTTGQPQKLLQATTLGRLQRGSNE